MDIDRLIVVDPAIRFGKPTVRGTRITVGDVLGYLAGGMSEAEMLEQFPSLTSGAVRVRHRQHWRGMPRSAGGSWTGRSLAYRPRR